MTLSAIKGLFALSATFAELTRFRTLPGIKGTA
jgi:hypothetical protein